jgi:hypothetical protein
MNEEYDYNFIDMYNFIDDLYKEKKINYNTKALLIK